MGDGEVDRDHRFAVDQEWVGAAQPGSDQVRGEFEVGEGKTTPRLVARRRSGRFRGRVTVSGWGYGYTG